MHNDSHVVEFVVVLEETETNRNFGHDEGGRSQNFALNDNIDAILIEKHCYHFMLLC